MTNWHPALPPNQQLLKAIRTDAGVTRVVWLGVVEFGPVQGGSMSVQGRTADALLDDMPLPYRPPGIGLAISPAGFEHWWRLLTYVFDLPDPSLFPPLVVGLTSDEGAIVNRFVSVSRSLASSAVVSATGGVSVSPGVGAQEEKVSVDFPAHDLQAGFATLFRQCEADHTSADFQRVQGILRRASRRGRDAEARKRQSILRRWRLAERKLHEKSVQQLMCDAFVEREGWQEFAYTEEWTPRHLLETFKYGDLIHWDSPRANVVPDDEDAELAAHQRFAFLHAALGLAHLYVGFGQLARAATTPPGRLLIP